MLCLHKGSLPFLLDELRGRQAGRKFNSYYSEHTKLQVSTLFFGVLEGK